MRFLGKIGRDRPDVSQWTGEHLQLCCLLEKHCLFLVITTMISLMCS